MRRLFAVVAALAAACAFAQDYSAFGFAPAGVRTEEGIEYRLLGSGKGEVLLSPKDGVADDWLRVVRTLVDAVFGMKNASVSSVRVVVERDRVIAMFMPDSFVSGDTDLRAFLPSGMRFFYSGVLEYDFRIKSGDYFVRMAGTYFAERDLVDNLLAAARDPVTFIKAHDPEYIIRKLTDMEGTIGAAKAEIEALKAETASLREENASLKATIGLESGRVGTALLAFMNKGWFSPLAKVDPAKVASVAALRASNPGISKADALKALRAAKSPVTDWEFESIFFLLFNE